MAPEPWFPRETYLSRLARVQSALRERGLDLLLAFQAESVTYLTGFFTTAYSSFQFAIIPAEGEPTIVCRDVEEYYLNQTAVFPRRVLWSDGQDTDEVAVAAIRRAGGASPRIGIETGALSAPRYESLRDRLGKADLVDVGDLVTRLRLIKSPEEITYQRRAARIAEATMSAVVAAAKAGASELDLAVAGATTMIREGSDRCIPGPMASGERAMHIHGTYTDRVLEAADTIHMETCPSVRYYHARFMRPIKVGRATREEEVLARRLIAVQDRALKEVRPGVPAAVPDRIYREGILATGAVEKYTNKTFYSVGLQFPGTWVELLEAAPGSEWRFEAGMTFHTYLIVQGLCFSETILVTDQGYERLTKYPRELIVA